MTAGQTVSHYEIVEKLGEGGMGVVYKARDLFLHRFVALKFLPPEIAASPERLARLEAEARAISALNHPNIATIHAMEEDQGRRFLVLEYLEGGTLRERIRGYRAQDRLFPVDEALRIGSQLAEGLAHAHRRGIVHRDIKPENIMFTAEGALRITDFGLAKSSHSSEITRDGATVGTAAYMGPEQAMRNETSPRGDLFAVGVVLYELVAGRRPFSGATELATLHAILHEEPPPLHLLRPEAPPDLESALAKLLRKDPAQRYQSAEELASDLDAVVLDRRALLEWSDSAPTRSLTQPIPLIAPPKRRRNLLLGGAIAFAVLLAIAVTFAIFRRPPPVPEKEFAVLPFVAASGEAEDVAFGNGLAGIVAGKLASLGANVVPQADLARNRVTSIADAKRVFGVPVVLTGRIERQSKGAPKVILDVVSTSTGKSLRSAKITATPVQDEVLREAAALVGLSPDPTAMSRLRAESTHTATAYDYYVLGNGYLQRWDQAGNLGFAIASFQKAIHAEPSYALAYAGLSSAYWQQYETGRDQQDLEHAREAAIQALSRNDSLAAPRITLGAIAVAAGETEEGIRQLRTALEHDPVNAEACRGLANALVAAGKLNEAEATYRRAIRYRPNFWLGYNDLGVFYNDHARYREAEQALSKAAALTPDNYIVHRNLGGVQMALGEWAAAESSFRKAIELRPRGSVYSNLGTLYIYTGRYADAVPVLEKAAALTGSERNGYIVWGNLADACRWTKGRGKDAAAAYEKAIELATAQLAINPRNAILLSQVAVYQAKAGHREEARKQVRDALAILPHNSSVLFNAALIDEIAGNRRQSLAELRAALGAGYSKVFIDREPELSALRADPVYKELR
ncbi:MAG TPA: protein kinase [Bryobacteraceae bacterium]|nr:protein kinase [Bryobacteraceae bacterium]